jgi:hypothetical protein
MLDRSADLFRGSLDLARPRSGKQKRWRTIFLRRIKLHKRMMSLAGTKNRSQTEENLLAIADL